MIFQILKLFENKEISDADFIDLVVHQVFEDTEDYSSNDNNAAQNFKSIH